MVLTPFMNIQTSSYKDFLKFMHPWLCEKAFFNWGGKREDVSQLLTKKIVKIQD